ncbi:MAG: phosphoglucosamine mutase [Burkholderiales bacterium]|nr:phosphoglucosamine mutase [Burkholderiales bacterium]
MGRKYFGTDGIRGRVGEAPITPDFVLRLGFAAGEVLVRRGAAGEHRPAVLIGKDTRVSGYMLEAALEAGFSAGGVDVMLCGPMPTPAVAYLTRALRLQAGIVISASHNPYPDNGIKFFSADGGKLPDAIEQEIEDALERPLACRPSGELGRARRIDDAAGRYIEFCKSTFPSALDLRGMRIAVDCANGAAYHVAPHVFHELGADVTTTGTSPNGLNINERVGATHPKSLADLVRASHADLGVALDGDGDRVVMADANGAVYDGDQLLYAIVANRARGGSVPGVVGTLMSNLALERALATLGVEFVRAKVGDRYVLELLHERGWSIGGENSGHIICLDKHTTGDGIVSALQVLTAMREQRRGLDEVAGALALYPQKLINVRVAREFDWRSSPAIARACADAETRLGERGRLLLRPSGTEPVLRVMVEGEDAAEVHAIAAEVARSVEQAAGRVGVAGPNA